jgi:hypothetical protein
MATLLDLPDEVITQILLNLPISQRYTRPTHPHLQRIALVSRRFRSISRPILFRTVRDSYHGTTVPPSNRVSPFLTIVQRDQALALSIQSIDLWWSSASSIIHSEVNTILSLLTNLRQIHIYANDKIGINFKPELFQQNSMRLLDTVEINDSLLTPSTLQTWMLRDGLKSLTVHGLAHELAPPIPQQPQVKSQLLSCFRYIVPLKILQEILKWHPKLRVL